ncbi:MAG: hypothetical protein UHZ05_06510 [Acutalibacteraceae bacterium]|nr:hypothetical protein [Acutalibacteraceae bacterium]
MNISVLSIIIVVLITAAVTIIFPENKYKNHLMLMTKIIVVVSIITAFVKSEMNFDFSAKYDQSVGDYGVISSVHDEIKNNIKEYVEAAFDTKCNIEINETELIIYVSSGDETKIGESVKRKFGIDCKVIKNEE